MIQAGTYLDVADNCGAKKIQCIGIPGSSKRKSATVGDIITVVVIGASSTGVVKDHSIAKSVIVRVRKEVRRKDGTYIRFDDNAGVLIDKDKNPIGTRVFGPIARELRDLSYTKIVSLAPEVW